MNLPFFIARRYLFAKKSHNVINIISAISATGMAVGTAALIIILSVYNGFDALIKANLNDIDPDILITPAAGKTMKPDDTVFKVLYDKEEIASVSSYLQETVFVNYDGQQDIATARGVDSVFERQTKIKDHVRSGEFKLRHGETTMCAVGSGFAYKMGINPGFIAQMEIYYPDRNKTISLSNPTSALGCIKAKPSCTFSINSEQDNSLIILPADKLAGLLKYEDGEISAMEVRLTEGTSVKHTKRIIKEIEQALGPDYRISDRYRQNESLYKMMKYEKAAIFLILIFVIIIIAFNIFGSLSMLIIEKKGDIGTLRSLGATDKLIRKIFILEGWLISLSGMAVGLIAGLLIAYLQQRFGFVQMPGNYLVTSYPVLIQWSDVLVTAAGVAAIGYLIALLPVASYCKND